MLPRRLSQRRVHDDDEDHAANSNGVYGERFALRRSAARIEPEGGQVAPLVSITVWVFNFCHFKNNY